MAAGFYIENIQTFPKILKIFDKSLYDIQKSFYQTKNVLEEFYKYPSGMMQSNHPFFNEFCNRYFSECDKVVAIGRTGIYQIMGASSVGSDFDLVINPEKNSIQRGVPYSYIKDKEYKAYEQKENEFNTKISRKGHYIFLSGLLCGLVELFAAIFTPSIGLIKRYKNKFKQK